LLFFFQTAAATIFSFSNHKILLANGFQRVDTYQHAKYLQNLSIGCEDIKIFFIFVKMAAAVILDFQI